jgi:uncharacterized protein YuzE
MIEDHWVTLNQNGAIFGISKLQETHLLQRPSLQEMGVQDSLCANSKVSSIVLYVSQGNDQ